MKIIIKLLAKNDILPYICNTKTKNKRFRTDNNGGYKLRPNVTKRNVFKRFAADARKALPEGDSLKRYKVLPYFAAKAIAKKVRNAEALREAGRPHYFPEGESDSATR